MTESENNFSIDVQLEALQKKITEINFCPKKEQHLVINPKIISEIQTFKEKMEEYSKQLEKSIHKLLQLEAENLVL